MHAFRVKKGSFTLENITKHYLNVFLSLNQSINKFQIFGQNHWLNPLENLQFGDRKECFLSSDHQETLLGSVLMFQTKYA